MKTVSGKFALLAVLAVPFAIEAAPQQQQRQSTQHLQQAPSRGTASDADVVRRTITKEDEEHEAKGRAAHAPSQPRRSIAPVEGEQLQKDIDAEMQDAQDVAGDRLRELADSLNDVSRELNSQEREVGESNPSEVFGPADRPTTL